MTHDKYDTDILKTLKSIDASLKSIAKSVQPTNATAMIDNNSEEAVREFLNSLHEKNIDECIGCNVKDCYDIYGDSTNEKCKWKDLIDKEAEEMKDDN